MLASVTLATACTNADVGSAAAPLYSGTLDDAPELFPGVVQVRAAGNICTGTLVAMRGDRAWILTAAHCFIDRGTPVPSGSALASVSVRFGADVARATPFPAVAVQVHPRLSAARIEVPEAFDAWPITTAYDFAVVEIAGVDAALSAAVIPTATSAGDGVGPGVMADGVGYGRVQLSGTTDGRRRRATFTVRRIEPGPRGFESIIIDQQSGAGLCPGDSGGPLVHSGHVVGVLSGATGGAATCGDFALSSRAWLASAELVEPAIAGAPEAPASCLSCAFEATTAGGACAAAVTADAVERQRFEACVQGAATLSACRARLPTGAAAHDAAWSCLVDTACPGLCGGVDRVRFQCSYSLDGTGPCDDCLRTNCCERVEACRGDPVCAACTDTIGVDPAPCHANAAYQAARACLDTSCDAVCGAYTALLPTVQADAGVAPDAGHDDAAATTPDAGVALDASARVDASAADAAAVADAAVVAAVDAAETTPPDAGCACRVEGSAGASTSELWLLLVVGAVVAGRRHRRSGAADAGLSSGPPRPTVPMR